MISISVIIPAHNSANTIAETLDSLLRQTPPVWSAIIVDDGSIDETEAIANLQPLPQSSSTVLS